MKFLVSLTKATPYFGLVLIGKELVKRGWRTQGKMGSDNWGYGVFEQEVKNIL